MKLISVQKASLILFGLVLCFSSIDTFAEVRTPGEAISVAKAFWDKQTGRRQVKSAANQMQYDVYSVSNETPQYYAVSSANGGFVIVAKDAASSADVLAYSGSGSFDSSVIPQSLFNAVSGTCSTDLSASIYGDIVAVEPMLGDIAWNQETPYNEQCPTWTDIDNRVVVDRHCPAGCVPVAVGQIMKYYSSPENYQWDNILPNYTAEGSTSSEESINEVARLLHDIGVAIDAKYDLGSTSASPRTAAQKLPGAFGYSPMMKMWDMNYFNPGVRRSIIMEELKKRRPVYIGGTPETGDGHAFVCDGMDSDGYLHINWGWGGTSNGWYHPLILSPSGEQGAGATGSYYSDNLTIITDLRPAASNDASQTYVIRANEFNPKKVVERNVELELIIKSEALNYSSGGTYYDMNGQFDPEWVNLGVLLTSDDSSQSVVGRYEATYKDGAATLSFDFPETEAGNWRIYPIYNYPDNGEWHYLYSSSVAAPYLTVRIAADGSITVENTFTTYKEVNVKASGLSLAKDLDPWNENPFSIHLDNLGKTIFKSHLYAQITDEVTGEQTCKMGLGNHMLSIDHGQHETLAFDITPVFFWFDPNALWDAEESNYVWHADHTYTFDFYLRDNDDYFSLASSNGHTIASLQIALADIEDANFKSAVKIYDINADGILSDYELAKVKELRIEEFVHSELPLLPRFKALRTFSVTSTTLKQLDFNQNKELEEINVTAPKLHELRLNGLSKLINVSCDNAISLEKIELCNLPKMETFSAPAWQTCHTSVKIRIQAVPLLSEFETDLLVNTFAFDQLPRLTRLAINFTPEYNGVDASVFPKLETLQYSGSTRKSQNLSDARFLKGVLVWGSGLEELILPQRDMESIDVRKTQLKRLEISQKSTGLRHLVCSDNQIEELSLPSVLDNLEEFDCNNNPLKELVFPSRLPKIGTSGWVTFDIDIPLENLSLPEELPNITDISIRNTMLKELTLPKKIDDVTSINIRNNKELVSIAPISNYPSLQSINCNNNEMLTSLGISNLPKLTGVYLYGNTLSNLTISGTPNVEDFSVKSNHLAELNIKGMNKIQRLDASDNELESINVIHLNGVLQYLDIYNNRMFYYEPPFEINELRHGAERMIEFTNHGIDIPKEMDKAKIILERGTIEGDRIIGDGINKSKITYCYADKNNAENAAQFRYTFYDSEYASSMESETVSIPLGEEGTITINTPAGQFGWPDWNGEWAGTTNMAGERIPILEYISNYGSGSVNIQGTVYDTKQNYVFKRVSKGDVTVVFNIGGQTLKCLVTSESGIEEIKVGDDKTTIDYSAPYEVYNLSGQRVTSSRDNLASGIYVIRQGANTAKIAIR